MGHEAPLREPDPMAFRADDSNLYRYAENDNRRGQHGLPRCPGFAPDRAQCVRAVRCDSTRAGVQKHKRTDFMTSRAALDSKIRSDQLMVQIQRTSIVLHWTRQMETTQMLLEMLSQLLLDQKCIEYALPLAATHRRLAGPSRGIDSRVGRTTSSGRAPTSQQRIGAAGAPSAMIDSLACRHGGAAKVLPERARTDGVGPCHWCVLGLA